VADLQVLSEYGQPDKVNDAPISIDSYEEHTGLQKQEQPQSITGNNFYGQQKTNQSMPPPAATNQANRADSRHAQIYPIGSLSPYAHKWTIKARVTRKSETRSWHKQTANGGTNEGSLFSVVFLDESGEIRATAFSSAGECFNEWNDLLQEGEVYYVSNPCKVGLAKKAFNQGVKNDYELTFERDTRIEKAQDTSAIPSVVYNFTTIESLQQVDPNTIIDTIGVLKAVGDAETITSKTTQKPFTKRELTLVDDTHHEVRLTIWGDQAQKFNAEPESVLAFKGVKVSDFGGRSLSLTSGGSMKVGPDIQEAHNLKGWYNAHGRTEKFQSHAGLNPKAGGGKANEWKTCIQVKDEHLGLSDNAEYFSIKATVQFISHGSPQATTSSMYYPACRSETCNKKVTEFDNEPGKWQCAGGCQKTWDYPEYRYILRVCVVDHTGSLWLNLFDKDAKTLFGKSADELHAMEDEMNREAFKFEVDSLGLWKTWNFSCRAKLDNYGEQQR
jgi:replication factor A1